MKSEKILSTVISLIFLLSMATIANAGNSLFKNRFKKGELLVKYKPSSKKNMDGYLSKSLRMKKVKSLNRGRVQKMKLPKNMSVEEAVQLLSDDPDVEFAEPNYIYSIDTVPDDPYFNRQWSLNNTGQTVNDISGTEGADIDAPDAWDIISNAGDVVVAVVDSGVDYNHPDLAPNIWVNPGEIPDNGIDDDGNGKIDDVRGWDYVTDDNDPMDLSGHGTHVAGTIGAVGNNGLGVAGLAWNTQIMIVRGLDADGWGDSGELAEAIQYAADNGADVINLSWGGGDYSDTLKDAIDNSGAVVVCAAGNSGINTDSGPHYPSSFNSPNIISVAATDQDDALAAFSNYGAASVDIGAPGTNIYSTLPARKTLVFEDFSSGWPEIFSWHSAGGWAVVVSTEAYSDSRCLTDSPSGDYPNGGYSWFETRGFDLSSENHINMEFYLKGVILEGDVLKLQASLNGGSWVDVYSFVGEIENWNEIKIDISQFKSTFTKFRVLISTDASNTADGVYIDDLKITAAGDTYDASTYEYYWGTSMAAPHVTGASALLKAMDPGLSSLAIKNIIEETSDPLLALSGKSTSGGRLNLNNIVSLYKPKEIYVGLFDFSDGLPGTGDGWTYYTTNNGRIEVINDRLRMDSSSGYALNEAILSLEMSGFQNVQLEFFQAEYGDEQTSLPDKFTGHFNGDGIAISNDGNIWYTILNAADLDTGVSGQTFFIDLDAAVERIQSTYDATFGYTLSFQIKFQQYDDYSYGTDGREWDNISIFRKPALLLTIPNSAAEGDGILTNQGEIHLESAAVKDIIITLSSTDMSEIIIPETIKIPKGEIFTVFDVTIVDDDILDGSQSASIEAANPFYQTSKRVIRIQDNETALLTVDIPSSRMEGDGTIAGLGIVRSSQAVDEDVIVFLQSSDLTELKVPEFVTISAGQFSAAFDLTIIDDNEIDGPQTVNLTASVAGWTSGSSSIDINDNENFDLTVTIPDVATESDSVLVGMGTVSISGIFASDIAIGLSSDDTTEVTVPESVIIPVGQTSIAFDLTIIDDTIIDGSQIAAVTAFTPGWISDSQTMTINDNDPGKLQFSSANYTAGEGDGVITIAVTRTVSPSGTISIDFTAESDTAIYGEDFIRTSGTLFFADGETQKTFDITILEDIDAEEIETLSITLSNPGGGAALGSPGEAVLSIVDNDYPSPPYSEDFSDGLPESTDRWTYYSSDSYGRIQVINQRLRMDESEYAHATLNEAVLTLNLKGFKDVQLDFFQAEYSDDAHSLPDVFNNHYSGDGIAISCDGITWYPIINASDLDTDTEGQTFSINMDAEVARIQADYDSSFGYSSSFRIKFQQYGNDAYPNDGREWDNIMVTGSPMLDLVIPESASEGEGTLVGQGSVTLETPAPEDIIVNLISYDLSEATVPAKVTIPAGQISINFDIMIIDDSILDCTKEVKISADAPGYPMMTRSIQVHDNETATLSLIVTEQATEGDGILTGQGMITVSRAVDEDILVTLQSDDTSELIVPKYATIKAGLTSAVFDLTIIDDSVVDFSQDVHLSASIDGWASSSETITINDNDTFFTIQIPPETHEGDGIMEDAGLISILTSLDADLIINLFSNDISEIIVPGSIILPAGQTSVSFDITVVDDGLLDGDQNITITASLPGWSSGEANIVIVDGNYQIGSEFQVSTEFTNDQKDPSATKLKNGGFVITWTSSYQDGYSPGIYGQIFDSSGSKIGTEFQVNTYTTSSQDEPSVAILENGSFVVTWTSYVQDGSYDGIYGQIFDGSGNKIGTEFQVNTYTTSSQNEPCASGLETGGFVVTWSSYGQDGSYDGIYGQIFDGSGNKIGTEFQANTYTTSRQDEPSVAGFETGGFVVTWTSYGQDGSSDGIYGQIFDGSGNKIGTEFQVNTYATSSQDEPSVAGLETGGFVVMWTSYGQDGSYDGIYGQIFDGSGSKIGTEFQINTYSASNQNLSDVAGLKNGGFLVTWTSQDQDGSSYGVFGQVFDGFGNRLRAEFQTNTYTGSYQIDPSVAGLENGDFVITWESYGQDTSGYGIFAQIFAADTDMDFLRDSLEAGGCTDPLDPDSDDDGIIDGEEDVNQNGRIDPGETNPCKPDSDEDGLLDGTEKDGTMTDPLDPDSDDDNMLDGYEANNGLDPLLDDAFEDKDLDGYSNYREFLTGSLANDGQDIPSIIADFDLDRDSDAEDLLFFTYEYGQADCTIENPCDSDMNNDGKVDKTDMSFMAEDLGRAEP